MKQSLYNVFVAYNPDNIYIGYNSVSGGLYLFNESQYQLVQTILTNPNNSSISTTDTVMEKLIKGRFLIDDDVDEIKILKLKNNLARFNPTGIAMVITPTLQCNFHCPYCYVDLERVSMSPQTITSLKNFFLKRIRKTDSAVICWTGGEPLLALGIVENLNLFFLEEAKKNKASFSCNMVTNGYLLTPAIIERLKKCGINSLQITIDGFQDYHNNLRYTIKGEKTYDRIIDNLQLASQESMAIILRSNIDKNNFQGVFELIDDIAKRNLNPDNFTFAPCRVSDVNAASSEQREHYFTPEAFALLEPKILLYAAQKGLKVSKQTLSPYHTHCGANTLSLHVIDAYANILKCWCNLGRGEKNKVGFINEDGDIILTNKKVLNQWMCWDPFEIDDCLSCPVLPHCMGGCMYHHIMGETNDIKVGCSTRRHNLKEMLILYYLSATKNTEQLKNHSIELNCV